MTTTTFTGTYHEEGGGKGNWSLNNGTSGTYSVKNYTYKTLADGSIQVAYTEDLLDSDGRLYATLLGTYTGNNLAQLPSSYDGQFLVTQNDSQYQWQNYYNGLMTGSGTFSSVKPIALDASKFSSGTWQEASSYGSGVGTWKTTDKNGYQGFYAYTGSSGAVNKGDIYLDVNSDSAYQADTDIKIGTYASVDTAAGGGKQGNWGLFAGSTQGLAWSSGTATIFNIDYPMVFATTTPSEITNTFLSGAGTITGESSLNYSLNNIKASSWTKTIALNLVAKASDNGDTITGKQIDFNSSDTFGSVIQGGKGNDKLYGKAGWDILDGGAGNDLIHGGNGRDIITGSAGSDELWGDFGWNTYKSEKDGSSDLIAIKSDQFLVNWMYGQAGNNPNGEKADIIEGLDSNDQIRIVGAATADLTFSAGASAHGVSGIGIYAKGALEALYTGGDLSVAQIQGMTSGDASAAAMSNSIDNYGWTQHPGIFVAA